MEEGDLMLCENCNKEAYKAQLVYCCARASYLPIACSESCAKKLGAVDPVKVADCGEHCKCGDCVDCELAARDAA